MLWLTCAEVLIKSPGDNTPPLRFVDARVRLVLVELTRNESEASLADNLLGWMLSENCLKI